VRHTSLMCLFGLLAAGCAGTTAQLSDFKKAETAKNYAAIESKSIDASCASGSKGSSECAQLAEIQGRACLTLAQQESAPNAACPPATDSARRRLHCAAVDFDAARFGHQFPSDQMSEITENRARALYCGATLQARSTGIADAREAARELDTLPANPQRDQLAAAAALYVANTDSESQADRCAAAARALSRAERGLQNSPSDDMKQGLMATADHAKTVATHLSNCRMP
jgi:hypothetical protein